MDYANFEDYWQPFLGGQGPVDFANLAPALNVRLKETARDAYCSGSPDGPQSLTAPAWAVRGKGAVRPAPVFDLSARGMHRYRVIGYDAKGERLFTLRVEALTKTDARLMALALLRRNRSGAALANRAERLVVRRDSADDRFSRPGITAG